MTYERYRIDALLDTEDANHGDDDYGRLRTFANLIRTIAANLDEDDVTDVYSMYGEPIARFTITPMGDTFVARPPLKLDSDGPRVTVPLSTPEPDIPMPTVTAAPTVCGQCGSPDVTVHDKVVLSYRPVAINGAIIPRGSTESSQTANLPDGSVRTIDDFYDHHLDIDDDETTECLNCGRIGMLDEDDIVPSRRARKFHVAYTGTDTDYEAVGRHQPLDPDMLPADTFEPDGVVVGQYQGDVYLYAVDADEAERLVVEAASYPITIELVEEDEA